MSNQTKQRIEQIRRGEVPEGYKKTKVGIVPDEWKIVKLDSISSHVTKKNSDGKIQTTFTNSATQGVIRQTDYFDKEISNRENITGYYVVQEDDYIYNPRISTSAPCGPINKSHFAEDGVASPLYTVFKMKGDLHKNRYIEYYLKSSFWHRYMCGVANYGARHDRMNITNDDLFGMPILFPTLEEQQKIAEILSAQDKLIALKEKLIEEKKRQKITIADKHFSPEYIKQKSPLANKTSFAQICSVVTDYVSNGSFKSLKDNVEYLEQGYAVLLRLADYNNGFDKNKFIYVNEKAFNFLSRSIVYPNDIIIANVGSVGAVFRAPDLKMPMSLAPNTILVRTNISNDYFYHFVCSTRGQELLKTITSTTAQPKFNKTDFKSLEMYVPNEDAQRNTSQILNLVDKEIEILKKDLDQEKQKKKALMQLLLTGIVRVK